jgi:hypothetical protein
MRLTYFALAALALGTLQGSPILSCPATLEECNGNEYGVSELSQVGNTFQIELDIHVLSTYTGNQFTDLVNAVQLKSYASGTITNTSLVSAPGGLSFWNLLSPDELNANGCDGGSSGTVRLCAEAKSPSLGAAFGLGDTLTWVFQFDTTGSLNSTTELKYRYVDSDGDKIGSLGSFNIGPQIPTVDSPEPLSLSLVGTGLLAMGLLKRRRRA